MANANLTFKVFTVSYGLNGSTDPNERRLRVGFIVYAKPDSGGVPPTINDGDLLIEVTIGQAEKKRERQPRFVATNDSVPDGAPTATKHRARLVAKPIGSTIQTWTAEAEVPIIFKYGTTPWTTGTVLFNGKLAAQSKGRNWKAVILNAQATQVVPLRTGTRVFPCLAAQLCKSARTSIVKDLSNHSYLSFGSDLSRLTDLTEELFARLAEGVNSIWDEAEADVGATALYGGYPLKNREQWAFGAPGVTGPPQDILGTKEQQKVAVANEVWARAITEIASFAPYYGPGPGYFDGDVQTVDHDTDGDVTVEIRSHTEYDLAEGVSGSQYRSQAFYPIVNACQQMATMAILSRGWWLSASLKPKNAVLIESESSIIAGSQAAVTYSSMLHPKAGTWVRGGGATGETPKGAGDVLIDNLGNDSILHSPDASALIPLRGPNETGFGPGSVAVFSNRSNSAYQIDTLQNQNGTSRTVARVPAQVQAHQAYVVWRQANPTGPVPAGMREADPEEFPTFGRHLKDNTCAAHIGTVLRIDAASGKYQVLDTGGLNTLNTGTSPFWSIFPGNHDYPETTGVMKGMDPYRGVGLAPVLTSGDADGLYKHVLEVVRQARPLGFMRLVVARRGPDMLATNLNEWLLYASPLLRMWGNGNTEGDRATLANLLWSLRDFPKRQEIRVIWSVRLPTGPLARAMMKKDKVSHVVDLVTEARQEMLTAAANNPNKQPPKDRVKLYVNCDDVTSAPASGAPQGARRAWIIRKSVGPGTLAMARILSRFTRLAADYEAETDGTVSIPCTLNANSRPFGYSGDIPKWHAAEAAHSPGPIEMLRMPLYCECGPMPTSDGAWDPTDTGFAAWVAQNNDLRTQVANDLISRFI